MKKIVLAGLSFSLLLGACAGSKTKKKLATPASTATAAVAKTPSIKDKTKSSKKIDGLFPLFQDTANGNVMLLVKKDQLNKDYIYFSYTVDGVVAAGHFRGSFRDNKVFTIRRHFDKIELIVLNTNFYFDPNNPVSKAAKANISEAILSSQKIVAEDYKTGEILIDASAVFLSESMQQIKPSARPGAMGFQLGMLSKDKTKFVNLRNYAKNTDLIVEYVYDNANPMGSGGKEVTDPRAVSIMVQHTLIEAPNNNFEPRADDPRIGYFSEQIEDMTSTEAVSYKDLIHRWHLVKKDPNAAISEPVEPIVWWIENTTPQEFRSTIKEAGEKWNIAFEKAGFKNAVLVKEQPDTANWDAGDIRYNVLRWTSSPQPPFGGYGPSFVDPRTGQILGADIMLEYIFVTNRLRQEKLFVSEGMQDEIGNNSFKNFCDAHDHLHQTTLFGSQVLNVQGLSEIEKRDYIKQSLYYLVLHEMGHTLGLNHNMKASQMLKPSQIHNKTITQEIGLIASVMDYPAANIAKDKNKQGDYFTTRPGPYDLWAIEFGYAPSLTDPKLETERQIKLLSRANDTLLIFGNDADDMRGSFSGIDPRVNVNDLSGDAISYGIERMQLSLDLMGKIKGKYTKPNQSYQELKQAHSVLINEYFQQANVIVKYIGGVYVNRAFVGQPGEGKAYTPVAIADQKRAMKVLSDYAFAPNSFGFQSNLYPYLQSQRRGFGFFSSTEDPKINERILAFQTTILSHLSNPIVLKRMSNTRLYGNTYSVLNMFTDLTNAIIRGDNGPVPTQRFNLQDAYVDMLISIVKGNNYDAVSQAAALSQLKTIERIAISGNEEAKAQSMLLNQKIKIGLEK
jgi:hypothetical protein